MTDKNIPENLRYTKEHEWAKLEDNGNLVTIGITHHAQCQLGDVVYLELPELGDSLTAEDTFGVVESVKAVSDLFAPLSGEVVETNSELVDAPEKINSDCYGSAWMLKIKPSNPEELEGLMSSSDYQSYIENESH